MIETKSSVGWIIGHVLKKMQTGNDRTAILSLSPQGESGTRRVFRLLPEIETQKAAGVSYTRMAEALGLEPAHFRVYLYRARKRALNTKMAGGGIPATSSASVTPTAAAKPDLMTAEGRKAAQAARFNLNINDEGE